jgi:hypothetical protein
MYILRALVFLFLTQVVLGQQPTPILPDPKLTPGDTFDVTTQGRVRPRLREEGAGRNSMAQKIGRRRVHNRGAQARRLRS